MRRKFTEVEAVEVWDRWQAGDAYRLIGGDLGRSAESIRAFVESWGGVRPPVRRRSLRHLSLYEREEISRGVAAGESIRCVAARLGRGTYRNSGSDGCYWEHLSGFSGDSEDLIANGFPNGDPAIVTIQPTDAGFLSEDCGRWIPNG